MKYATSSQNSSKIQYSTTQPISNKSMYSKLITPSLPLCVIHYGNIDIAEGLAMLKGDRAIEQDVI